VGPGAGKGVSNEQLNRSRRCGRSVVLSPSWRISREQVSLPTCDRSPALIRPCGVQSHGRRWCPCAMPQPRIEVRSWVPPRLPPRRCPMSGDWRFPRPHVPFPPAAQGALRAFERRFFGPATLRKLCNTRPRPTLRTRRPSLRPRDLRPAARGRTISAPWHCAATSSPRPRASSRARPPTSSSRHGTDRRASPQARLPSSFASARDASGSRSRAVAARSSSSMAALRR